MCCNILSKLSLFAIIVAVGAVITCYLVTHPNVDENIIGQASTSAMMNAMMFGLKTQHEISDDGDPATLPTIFPINDQNHKVYPLPSSKLRALDSMFRMKPPSHVLYDPSNEEQATKLKNGLLYHADKYVIDVAAMRKEMSDPAFGLFFNSHLVPKTHYTEIEIEGEYAAWVVYPGVDNSTSAKTIIYIHGGGAIAGTARMYTGFFYELSRATNARVLGVDYALAPEYPLPQATNNIIAAYTLLIDNLNVDPKHVVIAGESGGGHVSLLSLQAMRDRKMRMPAGGWIISAQTDITSSLPSITANRKRDAMLKSDDYVAVALLSAGLQNPLETDCKCSALHNSFEGLPPLFFQVSECEVLRDDSIAAYKKAKKQGVTATIEIEPHMPHAYPLFVVGGATEIVEAFGRGAGFIRNALRSSIDVSQYDTVTFPE